MPCSCGQRSSNYLFFSVFSVQDAGGRCFWLLYRPGAFGKGHQMKLFPGHTPRVGRSSLTLQLRPGLVVTFLRPSWHGNQSSKAMHPCWYPYSLRRPTNKPLPVAWRVSTESWLSVYRPCPADCLFLACTLEGCFLHAQHLHTSTLLCYQVGWTTPSPLRTESSLGAGVGMGVSSKLVTLPRPYLCIRGFNPPLY